MARRFARLPALALLLGSIAPGLSAQTAARERLLEPVWGAPAHCAGMLERVNRSASEPKTDDLLAVGQMLESGECVQRNEARASQFYGQAARRGNSVAARRLALLFGAGRGVPQSYANAGAWLAGKGDTDERIEPWDYSIGVAYTLIAASLEQLRYPQAAWPAGLALSLAIEADTQRPGRLGWRFTGERVPQAEALTRPIGDAIDAAVAQALPRMAPAESRYRVNARVTLPITVRHDAGERFVVTEQDVLLR
jgi:hypothetical protein